MITVARELGSDAQGSAPTCGRHASQPLSDVDPVDAAIAEMLATAPTRSNNGAGCSWARGHTPERVRPARLSGASDRRT